MLGDGIRREFFGSGMELVAVFKDIAKVDGEINSGCRAGRVDGAQDVDGGAAVSCLGELRTGKKTFFDSQRPFNGVVCKFEKGIIEIQGQCLEVIDDVFGGGIEFGVRNPEIRLRSVFSDREAPWRTSGYGSSAAVVKGLPDFSAVAVSESQDSGLRSPFGIDQVFNSRQEQKPSEHEVAEHRIFITISPEWSTSMSATSGDCKIEFLTQFFAWQKKA